MQEIHTLYCYFGSSSFITNTIGYVDQHLQYLPQGELFVFQQNSKTETRYKFSAKELDLETGYSYFGARYYDSDLSMWLNVDPLSDKYPSLSPYIYVGNNPVMIADPDGKDWFVDEESGNTYYNSRIGKDNMDELSGEYKNYQWLGKNDMFGFTQEEMNSYIKSDPHNEFSRLADYTMCDMSVQYSDETYDEAHFNGDNAKEFMDIMGYEFKAMYIEYTYYSTTQMLPEGSSKVGLKNSWKIINKEDDFWYVKKGNGRYQTTTAIYKNIFYDRLTNTRTDIFYKTAVFLPDGKMLPSFIRYYFNIDQQK